MAHSLGYIDDVLCDQILAKNCRAVECEEAPIQIGIAVSGALEFWANISEGDADPVLVFALEEIDRGCSSSDWLEQDIPRFCRIRRDYLIGREKILKARFYSH